MDDQTRDKVCGIAIHGDAAFAGQGVVYETIQMAGLKDYQTGGTIHFIVNNQIGFTTTPREARTGLYCTGLAKTVGAPIFHVNADDVEAVVKVSTIAAEFRQRFKKDVVVDIIGYRRFGHNELDQPSFTQPLMYKAISKHPPARDIYSKKLKEQGTLTDERERDIKDRIWNKLNIAYELAKDKKVDHTEWQNPVWEKIKTQGNNREFRITGFDKAELKQLGMQISTLPEDINPHRQIAKIYEQRLKSIEDEQGIDWGTAEALAWGSLIKDGFRVRISG